MFPNTNNYRTHKLHEIELSPITNADPGPAPGASVTETVPVEGTRPLNIDDTITHRADSVKSRDPLLQAIIGDKKRVDQAALSPEQFDGGALPTDADYGMMHIERTVPEYGGEARPENTSDFIRRSIQEVHGIHEGRNVTFGFRKPVEPGLSGSVGSAGSIQAELTALGVPCFLTDGFVDWNRDGLTRTYPVEEASTYAGEGVFINGMTTMPPKYTAGHEAFHYWKGTAARNVFREILLDNLIFSSDAFVNYQNTIAQGYLGEPADVFNGAQIEQLMEELSAYICGDLHEGSREAELRAFLRDYDAVKARA